MFNISYLEFNFCFKIGSSASSYPKQQWSSSGSSYPKQQTGTSGGSNLGGSSGASQYGGKPVGGGGFSSGSPGYASGGAVGGSPGAIGGGGFVAPKPAGSNAGGYVAAGGLGAAGGFAAGNMNKPGSTSTGGIGGGGFVNPSQGKPGFQGSGYPQPSAPSMGSSNSFGGGGLASHGLAGAAGAAGGYGLGKTNRYTWPKASVLSPGLNKQYKSAYSPGYGSNYGTSFTSANMYKQKKGFSKKALGLGVAAGFVGGAALGVAGTMATYSAYHRYQEFKNMMMMGGFGNYDNGGFGNDYRSSFYKNNQCFGGCPMNSHCEWGFCECNAGYDRKFGQCGRLGGEFIPRPSNFDPFIACAATENCQKLDMNMICNTNLTIQSGGKCQCKPDMKWNEATGECQIFIDVDCSSITYDTPPSKLILAAVQSAQPPAVTATVSPGTVQDGNQTLNSTIPQESNFTIPEDRTPTIEESLSTSLLSKLDRDQATANDLKEAFCRDVDAFSFDLNVDDGKPSNCDPVPRTACGVVYDSSSCSGGWKLIIAEGAISFPYFSSYWKYRNDIDLIGVKAGCTLTGFSDTGFSGNRGTFRADASDQWWVLAEHAEFLHLDSDIESIQCVCRKM